MRKALVTSVLLLFLTGCWDKVEIEDRGFVIGIGLDQAEEEDQILMTQQFVVPAGIGAASGQAGGSKPGGSDAFMNVKETGTAPFEIVREVAARTSRSSFFGHTKAIIISEELATERGIKDMLDFFMRDPEMRRGIIVFISKGKASDILGTTPKNEKLPTLYITSLMNNTYKNGEINPRTRTGEIHEYFLRNKSFTMTMIEKDGKDLVLKNTAVIQGTTNKMVGKLKRDGTMGLNFIRDEIQGGIIKANVDDKDVLFEIYRSKSEIKANVQNREQMQFHIDVEMEGAVIESQVVRDYFNEGTLQELAEHFEDKVKDQIRGAIKQTQEEFATDVLGFSNVLRQQHYKTWADIKDDWDTGENYFSKVDISVHVNVNIRNAGVLNKTKE